MEGRLPENEFELLGDLRDGERKVGDVFINTTSGEEYTLVGLLSSPQVFAVGDLLIDDSVNKHLDKELYHFLYLRFKDGIPNVKELTDSAVNNLRQEGLSNPEYVMVMEPNETLNMLLGMNRNIPPTIVSLLSASIFVASLFMIFTSSLITNAFQVFTARQEHSYGILRSVGATRKQIRRIMQIQLLTLSLLSIVFGVFGGLLIAQVLTSTFHLDAFSFSPIFGEYKSYLPFEAMSLIVLACIVLSLLSSWKTNRDLFKQNAIETVRKQRKSKYNKKRYLKDNRPISSLAKTYTKKDKKQFRGIKQAIILSLMLFIGVSTSLNIIFKAYKANEVIPPADLRINMQGHVVFDEEANQYVDKVLTDYKKDIHNIKEYIWVTPLELRDQNHNPLRYSEEFKGYGESVRSSDLGVNVLIVGDSYLSNPDEILFRNSAAIQDITLEIYDLDDVEGFYLQGITVDSSNKLKSIPLSESYQFILVNSLPQEIEGLLYRFNLMRDAMMVMSETRAKSLLAELNSYKDFIRSEKVFNITTPRSSELSKILNSALGSYKGDIVASDLNSNNNYYRALLKLGENILLVVTVVMTLSIILNLVSLSLSSLQKRRSQLAVLQSIGMEKKGVQKMMLWESVYTLFWPVISGIILGIIIAGMTYFLLDEQTRNLTVWIILDIKTIVMSLMFSFVIMGVNYLSLQNEAHKFSIVEDVKRY